MLIFTSFHKNRLWRNEVAHKRKIRAMEQTKMVRDIIVAATGSRRPSFCHGDRDGSDGGGTPGDGVGAVAVAAVSGVAAATAGSGAPDKLESALTGARRKLSVRERRSAFRSTPAPTLASPPSQARHLLEVPNGGGSGGGGGEN